MSPVDTALALFDQEYNCAQAVFVAFAPQLGLSREQSLALAAPFGGGLGRQGEACGAVTGALMAIGLRYGGITVDHPQLKGQVYDYARQFCAQFTARHGAIICRDLLGCDIGTPEGWQEAQARDTHHTLCRQFVADAVRLLEEFLASHP